MRQNFPLGQALTGRRALPTKRSLPTRTARTGRRALPLRRSLPWAFAPLVLALASCTPEEGTPRFATFEVIEVSSPAAPGAGEPNLFAGADGRVYLNWFEREGRGTHVLKMSSFAPAEVGRGGERGAGAGGDRGAGAGGDRGAGPGGELDAEPGGEAGGAGLGEADGETRAEATWSEARTITRGDNFFVNWADFPSLHRLADGTLWAHWLVRSGPDTYDYDVHLARSTDDGRSWSESIVPHRDGTRSEHGFVSLFPAGDDGVGVVWLDGREFANRPGHPEMTLRFTTVEGVDLGPEILLDDRVCDCCQTSAAITDRGPLVVYRDRSSGEIRDISAVRLGADGWSEPRTVHPDGWEIAACPVNGPMVAAEGEAAAVAWFTAARDEPRVLAAFSSDAGDSWSEPLRLDEDGEAVGRVATVLLPSGNAVVSWLARDEEGGGVVQLREIHPGGAMGPVHTVSRASAARAGGFPRMVRSGDDIVLAWRDLDGEDGIRVALFRMEGR